MAQLITKFGSVVKADNMNIQLPRDEKGELLASRIVQYSVTLFSPEGRIHKGSIHFGENEIPAEVCTGEVVDFEALFEHEVSKKKIADLGVQF